MNMKKLAGAFLSLVMSLGILSVFPAAEANAASGSEKLLDSKVTDRNGFIMAEDDSGDQFVCGYSGPGGAIKLPADAAYVGAEAFAGNKNITSLTVPSTCWNCIESRAFAGCINLRSVVFEGNIEYIGEEAFCGCIGLKKVVFGGSVCESDYYGRYDGGGIFDAAFFGCCSLESVRFKKGSAQLSCIGTNAFANCLSLSDIRLPERTPTIYGAFINCPKLLSVSLPLKTMIDKGSFGYLKDYGGYDDDPLIKADGRTTVQALKFVYDYASNTLVPTYVPITPPAIVLSVIKGSDADQIADKYKINHVIRLPAPNNVAAMGGKTNMLLIWNKVGGADGYRVYKYNYDTKSYFKFADVTSPQLAISDLDGDTTYKFIVAPLRKVNGVYIEGERSKPVKFRNSNT